MQKHTADGKIILETMLDVTVPAPAARKAKSKKRKIPAYLVKETIDGRPFYYAGFRSVLNKRKTLDDIMPDSSLQILIKMYLSFLMYQKLNLSKYWVFSGEFGLHIEAGKNLSLDFAVVDMAAFPPEKFSTKYLDIPPKVVVEIDVNVQVDEENFNDWEDFIIPKINKLHEFGTRKVIWIFTKSRKIVLAEVGKKWETFDWDKDVEILDGVVFNIAGYLAEKGIRLEGA